MSGNPQPSVRIILGLVLGFNVPDLSRAALRRLFRVEKRGGVSGGLIDRTVRQTKTSLDESIARVREGAIRICFESLEWG